MKKNRGITLIAVSYTHLGFIKKKAVRGYAEKLIKKYDIRSGEGPVSIVRGMSGGKDVYKRQRYWEK